MMFDEKKYQPVKEILSKDIVDLVTQYTLLDEITNFTAEETSTDNVQVPGSHSRYADILMESLLLKLQPSIELVSGKTLIPTYSYYRVYRPGQDLKPHTDRESCEISVTVSFGRNYQGANYNWGMFVNDNGDNKEIVLDPGDAIVYKGCEITHWRDKFNAPDFSYHIQGFFHYVDANGPYKDFALDKRTFIGQQTYTKPVVNTVKEKSYIIRT